MIDLEIDDLGILDRYVDTSGDTRIIFKNGMVLDIICSQVRASIWIPREPPPPRAAAIPPPLPETVNALSLSSFAGPRVLALASVPAAA